MATEDELQRVVLCQRLKSDAVDDYVAAHQSVPDSVVETMEAADVESYELYVKDDIAMPTMDHIWSLDAADSEAEWVGGLERSVPILR